MKLTVVPVAQWLLVAEPVACVSSALAPCDLGCPSAGSLSQSVHNLLAVITLPMTTVGLVLLSRNDRLTPAKKVGWAVLAATFIRLYTFALVPGIAEWRGLRLAEGILYGCLCLVSWGLFAGHNNPAELSRQEERTN